VGGLVIELDVFQNFVVIYHEVDIFFDVGLSSLYFWGGDRILDRLNRLNHQVGADCLFIYW
jgi:hypothetical protein